MASKHWPLLSALLLSGAAFTVSAQYNDDVEQYDSNRDGVITRREWRGDMRSFRQFDINRDGVLSGTEVRGDDDRRGRRDRYDRGRDRDQRRNRTSDNSPAVDRLDENRTGVVEGHEWPYNANIFHQLDRNADSVLSADELNNISNATLNQLDRNRNGRVDNEEWPGGFAQLERLDSDRDGRVSAEEYTTRGGEWQRRQRFEEWDSNRDGRIQSTEWKSAAPLFHRLDTDRDSTVSLDEFLASTERYDRPFGWR